MVPVRPGQVVQGGLHLLGPAQPGVPGIQVMLSALGQVITVILTQPAEPSGSRELGAFVGQWVQILALRRVGG